MDVWWNYHTFDGNYCNPNYTNNKSQNIKSSLAQYCTMFFFFTHFFCEVINMNITYIIYKLHSYNKFIHSEIKNPKKKCETFICCFFFFNLRNEEENKKFPQIPMDLVISECICVSIWQYSFIFRTNQCYFLKTTPCNKCVFINIKNSVTNTKELSSSHKCSNTLTFYVIFLHIYNSVFFLNSK